MVTTITDSLQQQHIYDSDSDSEGSTIHKSPNDSQLKVISPAKITPKFTSQVNKQLKFGEEFTSLAKDTGNTQASEREHFLPLMDASPNRTRCKLRTRRNQIGDGRNADEQSQFSDFYRSALESPPYLMTSDSSGFYGSSNSSFNNYESPNVAAGAVTAGREIRSAESQPPDSVVRRTFSRSRSLQMDQYNGFTSVKVRADLDLSPPASPTPSTSSSTSTTTATGADSSPGGGGGDEPVGDGGGRGSGVGGAVGGRPLKRRFSDERPSIDFIKMKRSIFTPSRFEKEEELFAKEVSDVSEVDEVIEKPNKQIPFHINADTDSDDAEVSMISEQAADGDFIRS